MENHKSIPEGYMTVGEMAKKMGTTVRTLQYYDKEGLLTPSAESYGGFRLYTDKDIVKLHQILSMKHLGFSLGDIKNKLVVTGTPSDMINFLSEHAAELKAKINGLSESLKTVETLMEEVAQMHTTDFKKYADIVVNLQMKNEDYWIIKHLDEDTLEQLRGRFNKESALKMIETMGNMSLKALKLLSEGVLPESDEGQTFAKEYWGMLMEFSDGDISIFSKVDEIIKRIDNVPYEWREKHTAVNQFIQPALEVYFKNTGVDPTKGEI